MEFKTELNNECAFHIEKKDGFCSPIHIIDKLKNFVVNFTNTTQSSVANKSALEILKSKYKCNSETCVLSQYDVKRYVNPETIEKVLKENFKPVGPRMSSDWLSNFDIDDVLEQITKKYEDKHFLHISFQMRDFEKTNGDLARLNWQQKYNEGYRTFGTVVNTDYSSGRGLHWFALFGDFLNDNQCFTIEYYNSSGELPLSEIATWMKKFKHSLNLEKPIKDIVVTRIQSQYDNFSCGAYSLYYIISRLDGVPWEWFRKNKVKDKDMQLFRQYLFRDDKN